jgi:predicted HicB family RNase H-like nuclease
MVESQTPRRLVIDGHECLVEYDRTTDLFAGRFVGLNGSAPFYARKERQLRSNASRSLCAYLKAAQRKGVPAQHR